jgi:hypothetical protein
VTTTYIAGTHRWLRLRHLAPTLFWEFSTDGLTGWTAVHSEAAPIPLTAIAVEIGEGWFGASPGQVGTVLFDSVNITPASTVSLVIPNTFPRALLVR